MRALALVALALLTLVSVATVFHRIAPYPTDDLLGEKLQYFADHKDDYDLLVIGSSRTLAGVMPKQIETAMAARGAKISAFNLAVNAMGSHETDATLRRVLDLEPARLRWMLVELDYWQGTLRPKKRFQQRTFLWHDAETSYAAMRSTFLFARPHHRQERMLTHLLHFGGYVTALGRGPQVVASLRTPDQSRQLPAKLIENRGYQEPGWCDSEDRERAFSQPCGAKSSDDPFTFYRRRLKVMKRRSREPGTLDGVDLRAVKRRSDMLRRAGVIPIHFIPPRLKPTKDLWQLRENGIIDHLLAFNDTVAYRELYALENRCDCDHLSQPGAERLSALLAERLSEITADSTSMAATKPSRR